MIRLIPVHVPRAVDAIDAASRQCTAVTVSSGLRCARSDNPGSPFGRYRLHALPLPQVAADAYAVLCEQHFDEIRREDRKAAQARAEALAAETQTSLF